MKYSIKYVTHLPVQQGSPEILLTVESEEELQHTYSVRLTNTLLNRFMELPITPGVPFYGPIQYLVLWKVEIIKNNNEIIHTNVYNCKDKVVFIKMDAYALGDNLAWIPYVEAFRQASGAKVICSTFWNNLFINSYPDIMFVQPNTRIDNVYAQYYVGTHDKNEPIYQPSSYIDEPLQFIAADILGLDRVYLKAKINQPTNIKKQPNKICISEFASLDMKRWHGDWQKIVDTLIEKGYEVVAISREKTALKNVIDKTGDLPIEWRVNELTSATYFIGCSSGLSWLAHSCDCHVFLISDFTPPNHEFQENITRIYNPESIRWKIKYEPVENEISTEDVLIKIQNKLGF